VKKTMFKSRDFVFISEGSEKQEQATGHSQQRVKTSAGSALKNAAQGENRSTS